MTKVTSFPVVRIRPKGMGALPVGLKGKLYGQPFKVVIQYDAFGGVRAQVIEDETGGDMITEISGKAGEAPDKAGSFAQWAFNRYKKDQGSDYNDAPSSTYGGKAREADKRDIEKRSNAFIKDLFGEVKNFNSGKDTKTKKAAPITIAPKKAVVVKKKVIVAKPAVATKAVAKKYGLNSKMDAKRSALLPGKRNPSSGKPYYEYRVNRTDQKGKKI